MSDIEAQVDAILRRYSGCGAKYPIRTLTTLDGDLGIDSLDRIEIGQHLEEAFGFSIPDDDLDQPSMGTFGGICAYIGSRQAAESIAA